MAIDKIGTFTVAASGVAQNLNLGFFPSRLQLWNDSVINGGSGSAIFTWFNSMANGSSYVQNKTGASSYLSSGGVTPFQSNDSQLYPSTNRIISAITQAANAQVTSAAHGFISADVGVTTVTFHNVVGMVQINTLSGVIQSIVDANNFTVNINTTNFSSYISGGIANIITGVPPVTQTGFQVYNTPLSNLGFIGVMLGSGIMVAAGNLFRYQAELDSSFTSD